MSDYLLLALWAVVATVAVVHAPEAEGRPAWCRRCADRPVSREGRLCRMCRTRRVLADDTGIEKLGL